MFKRYIAVFNSKGEFLSIHATNALTTKLAKKRISKKLNIHINLVSDDISLKELSWSDIEQIYEQKQKEEKMLTLEKEIKAKLNSSSNASPQVDKSKLVKHFTNLDLEILLNIATDLLWQYHKLTRNAFLKGSLEKNIYTQYLIGVMADSIENLPHAINNSKNNKEYLIEEIAKYLSEIVNYFNAMKNDSQIQSAFYQLWDDIKMILSENEFFFDLLLQRREEDGKV